MNEIYKNEVIDRRFLSPKAALNIIGSYKIHPQTKLFALQEKVYNCYQTYLKENNLDKDRYNFFNDKIVRCNHLGRT